MKWASRFSINKFRAQAAIEAVMLWLWLGLSLLSLAAMYHLWWSRERVLYAGKSAADQRVVVFERAGIPAQALELAKRADAVWPLDAAYEAAGSEGSLSYFQYLVLPRVPSGSDTYRIEENNGIYVLAPEAGAAPLQRGPQAVEPSPRGLVLSALVLFAVAAGLSRWGLSIPEGMAAASLLLCVASVLLKAWLHSYAPIGVFTCAMGVIGAGMAWKRKRAQDASSAGVGMSRRNWRSAVAWGPIVLLVGTVFWGLLMAVVVVPDDWDAWAIWGPKAKVMLLGTGPLSDAAFFGHPDYPLLWPSVWAFSGWCAGGWEDQWSKGWGALFLALAAWQMAIIVARIWKRKDMGWLLAAVFASMPAVPLIASWGYAEAPLWLMMVCGMGRLLQWREWKHWSDAAWAGVFAGAAALTKNEGALFGVMGFLWIAGFHGRMGWRHAAGYLAVFVPLYCSWLVWVRLGMDLRPAGSLGVGVSSPEHVLDRFIQSLPLIAGMWMDVRQWNIVIVGALAAAVGGLVRRPRVFVPLLFVPGGMLLGSLMVIVLREGDLGWQIGTAWNRLTIQLFALLLPVLAVGFARNGSRRGLQGSLAEIPDSPLPRPGHASVRNGNRSLAGRDTDGDQPGARE